MAVLFSHPPTITIYWTRVSTGGAAPLISPGSSRSKWAPKTLSSRLSAKIRGSLRCLLMDNRAGYWGYHLLNMHSSAGWTTTVCKKIKWCSRCLEVAPPRQPPGFPSSAQVALPSEASIKNRLHPMRNPATIILHSNTKSILRSSLEITSQVMSWTRRRNVWVPRGTLCYWIRVISHTPRIPGAGGRNWRSSTRWACLWIGSNSNMRTLGT